MADHPTPLSPARPALAANLVGNAQTRLLGLAEEGKHELAGSIDNLVALARQIADGIDGFGGGSIAAFSHDAADRLAALQTTLRDTPVEELIDEGRALVRRQPEIAIGVALVAGFLAARVIKAGSR